MAEDTESTEPIPMTLTVRDAEGTLILERHLDFTDFNDRKIIAKTAWWAMHSGYELLTRPNTMQTYRRD